MIQAEPKIKKGRARSAEETYQSPPAPELLVLLPVDPALELPVATALALASQ